MGPRQVKSISTFLWRKRIKAQMFFNSLLREVTEKSGQPYWKGAIFQYSNEKDEEVAFL